MGSKIVCYAADDPMVTTGLDIQMVRGMTAVELIRYVIETNTDSVRRITSTQINQMTGIRSYKIRRSINELRRRGVPICSDNRGYFYSTGADHIDATVTHLREGQDCIQAAIDGLLKVKEGSGTGEG